MSGEWMTCGPTTVEQHPRQPAVTRCSNCKEWLRDRTFLLPDDSATVASVRTSEETAP